MTNNNNSNKLYHAASLAQRELEPVLNAITNKVCEDYESFRPCPPIESMHELIILVIDTVFLVEIGNRLSLASKFNANELAVCAVSRLLSWRNRHPSSCRGFEFTNEQFMNEHFIDTCFEISISVRDGCRERSIDYESLLNRYSFSRSEIDYIIFFMSGQCEPIIDRFQVFRCDMSEKEIPLLKTENIYYDAPGKKCLLTESDLILLTFFHTLDDSAT
jgi:hypothetical protein